MNQTASLGRIFTFYSYKGGVGRSMALANVATLLASSGHKVLMVDFDLEAPGLERYFEDAGAVERRKSTIGVTELISRFAAGKKEDWRKAIINVASLQSIKGLKGRPQTLHLISAGRRYAPLPKEEWASLDDQPTPSIEWGELFAKHNIGEYLGELRDEWRQHYDIVLLDSRTGISDIGGICTIILPDVLVLLFTANGQSVEGCIEVIRAARRAQEQLPEERAKLIALPVLARDDRGTEYDQSREWRERISRDMAEFFGDWLPAKTTASAVLHRLYIPHVPYWSFGERRPVAERPEELEDPATLSSAYNRLATFIGNGLDWSQFEKVASAADRQAELDELRRLEVEARILREANRALESDVAEIHAESRSKSEIIDVARSRLIDNERTLTAVQESLARAQAILKYLVTGLSILGLAFLLSVAPNARDKIVALLDSWSSIFRP